MKIDTPRAMDVVNDERLLILSPVPFTGRDNYIEVSQMATKMKILITGDAQKVFRCIACNPQRTPREIYELAGTEGGLHEFAACLARFEKLEIIEYQTRGGW